jgi:hypothetical protein
MKILIPGLLTYLAGTTIAGRGKQFEKTYPAAQCSDITAPQRGMWIDMGVPDDNIKMSEGCTAASDSKRCTVWCKGYDQSVVLDRSKEDKYDRRISADKQKKFLLLCRCSKNEATGALEDCKWSARRRWSKKDYNEQHSNRMKRETDDPKAIVYAPGDVRLTFELFHNIVIM